MNINKGSIKVTSRTEELKTISSVQSGTVVNTTGTETVNLLADATKIGEVYHIGFYAPAIGGATGNHRLKIYMKGSNFETLLLDITCAATQAIQLVNGIPYGTYSAINPTTDLAAIAQIFKNLRISNGADTGLHFIYYNTSNTDQTGVRRYIANVVQRGA